MWKRHLVSTKLKRDDIAIVRDVPFILWPEGWEDFRQLQSLKQTVEKCYIKCHRSGNIYKLVLLVRIHIREKLTGKQNKVNETRKCKWNQVKSKRINNEIRQQQKEKNQMKNSNEVIKYKTSLSRSFQCREGTEGRVWSTFWSLFILFSYKNNSQKKKKRTFYLLLAKSVLAVLVLETILCW